MLTLPFPITGLMMQVARPLLQSGNASVAAATSASWTNLCFETMPGGERGYITSVGVEVDDNDTGAYDWSTAGLIFRLTLNQAAPIEFEGWTSKRGNIIFPTPTVVRVEPGSIIALQVRRIVAEASARTVAGMFNGFRFPITVQKPGTSPDSACLSADVRRLIPS
ncbi:MAG: hypothetical protein RL030_1808 [Pseudomonadota bacterium]